jgi:hypothetical protein
LAVRSKIDAMCAISVRTEPEEADAVGDVPQVESKRVAGAAGADDQVLVIEGEDRVVDPIMRGVKHADDGAVGGVQQISRVTILAAEGKDRAVIRENDVQQRVSVRLGPKNLFALGQDCSSRE